MTKRARFTGMFLCLILALALLFPLGASAASAAIDVSTAEQGYFTVICGRAGEARMKVGVKCGGVTQFCDYAPGSEGRFSFAAGNGSYTLTLYQNVSGASYREIASENVTVKIADEFSRYLLSTTEVTFAAGDAVSKKAGELCTGLTTDSEKAAALYRYIAENFSYDYLFAAKVVRGEIKSYTPKTADILSAKAGMCYDFSALYAAMCRSQGIPCALVKGAYDGGSHAWNSVYAGGAWHTLDLSYAIEYGADAPAALSDCVTPLSAYAAAYAA